MRASKALKIAEAVIDEMVNYMEHCTEEDWDITQEEDFPNFRDSILDIIADEAK